MLDKFIEYWGFDHLSRWENDGDRVVSPTGLAEIQKITGIKPWPDHFPMQVAAKNGKFAVRLASWSAAQRGVEMDKKTVSRVGALAEAHATPSSVMWWAIHKGIMRWNKEGTFRESGSCFYDQGSNGTSSKYLEDAGGISLCLYRPGGGGQHRFFGNFTGAGRCFLIPYKGDVLGVNIYYQNDNRQVISLLANLFTQALGKEVTYRSMLSRRINIGRAYVNVDQGNEHHASFILYSGKIKDYDQVDIASEREWNNQNCNICRKLIHWTRNDHGPRSYCSHCGNKCKECGDESTYYGLTWLVDKEAWYCRGCTPKNLHSCDRCGRTATKLFDCDCGGEGSEHEPGF